MKKKKKESYSLRIFLFVIIILFLLVVGIGVSIMTGARDITFNEIFLSLLKKNTDITTDNIIWELRLPRPIAAALVGAFLAIASSMLQGMTRNPLSDSSVLGINQGASLMMAIALSTGAIISNINLMLFSLIGASASGFFVYFISSRSIKGVSVAKLILAGTAIGTLLISLATIIALRFNMSQKLTFWIAGTLVNADWMDIKLLLSVGTIFIILSIILSPYITILSLGDEVAIGLGQNTKRIKFYAVVIIIVLTGTAVSVAGNVGLIGLIVPQIIRGIFGSDYRRIIPLSGILGATLLVYSDILSRVISNSFEVPLGSVTAFIGVPFFIYLIRKNDII